MQKLFKHATALAMVLLIMTPVFAFVALPAHAAAIDPFGGNGSNINSNLGLGNKGPQEIAASVLNILMGFLGIVAVIIILMGGFKWMTAGGGEDKIAEAKKMITAGVIGLLIVLAAWGITIFVLNSLLNATGANTNVNV